MASSYVPLSKGSPDSGLGSSIGSLALLQYDSDNETCLEEIGPNHTALYKDYFYGSNEPEKCDGKMPNFCEKAVDLAYLIKKHGKFSYRHKKLDMDTAEIISQALQKYTKKQLSELDLRNSSMSTKILQMIFTGNKRVIVGSLNLSANEGLDMATVKEACDIFEVKTLDLSDTLLSDKQVRGLAGLTGIKKLELRNNTFHGNSVGPSLAALINAGLETLVLDDSDISGEQLRHIAEEMSQENRLTGLDLSHISLDKKRAGAVRQIVTKAGKMEWINLHNCRLNGALMEILFPVGEKNYSSKVRKLKLSANPRIKDSLKTIATIAAKLNCEDLDISRNSLGGKDFTELAATSTPNQIKIIHIRENPVGDWSAFGKLVKKWGIRNVYASQCRMYQRNAKEFAASLGTKNFLEMLNVHHMDRDEKAASLIHGLLSGVAHDVTC